MTYFFLKILLSRVKSCIRKENLMFMSSSRDEFTRSWKNWVTDVSAAMLVPLRGTQTWLLRSSIS